MRACSTAAAFASNASRPRSRIPRCAAWIVIAAPRFSWKLASAPYRRQLLAMQLAACSSVIRCPLNIDMSAAPQPAPASRMLPNAWRGERERCVGGRVRRGGGGGRETGAHLELLADAARRAQHSVVVLVLPRLQLREARRRQGLLLVLVVVLSARGLLLGVLADGHRCGIFVSPGDWCTLCEPYGSNCARGERGELRRRRPEGARLPKGSKVARRSLQREVSLGGCDLLVSCTLTSWRHRGEARGGQRSAGGPFRSVVRRRAHRAPPWHRGTPSTRAARR